MKTSLLILLWSFPSFAAELLPQGRLFPLTFADPREIKMSLHVAGNQKIGADIGNYFSLVGWEWNEKTRMHLGIEGAGYFLLRQEGGRFPLETTDGLIGLYQELELDDLKLQFRFTHVSSHLSDGIDRTPIAYSKEWLSFRALYDFNSTLLVYGGTLLHTNSIPRLPALGFQAGVEFFLQNSRNWLPFLGIDYQWKPGLTFSSSAQIQMGIALRNSDNFYRNFKFYYAYYAGANYRGQFYDESLNQHSFGIEMQI